MLVLRRKVTQSIVLAPDEESASDEQHSELFKDGPVEIVVLGLQGDQVRLGVKAPRWLVTVDEETPESR